LFPETYAVWDKTLLQYKATIKAYYPNNDKVENYVNTNSINAFYNSVELRKECCFIRKVEPLNRALQGAKIWITGLRAEQSENRNSIQKLEWDEQRQLYKYNPLLNWTTAEVVNYLKKHGVPYNTLHDSNFVSIGCAPCTRALKEGEDFRAGRWWWEDQSKKECGLHR
jgi:phosphoadenosine phosphosulfate reductase